MRMYFAGGEAAKGCLPKLVEAGARHAFISYYHLVDRMKEPDQRRVLIAYRKAGIRVVIDSGAFTFLAEARRESGGEELGGDRTLATMEEYLLEYVAWVERNRSLLDHYIELDLQDVVGVEVVAGWRRIFAERGLQDGLWLCHHRADDWDAFADLVERSRVENGGSGYCGVGGVGGANKGHIDYQRCTRHAYEQGVCIHAFASTRGRFLGEVPVSSSDSTTWNQSSRSGVQQVFDPIYGGVINKRPHEPALRKVGVRVASRAWTKLYYGQGDHSDRVKAINRYLVVSVREFLKMERYITELWESRGFDWDAVEAEVGRKRKEAGIGQG